MDSGVLKLISIKRNRPDAHPRWRCHTDGNSTENRLHFSEDDVATVTYIPWVYIQNKKNSKNSLINMVEQEAAVTRGAGECASLGLCRQSAPSTWWEAQLEDLNANRQMFHFKFDECINNTTKQKRHFRHASLFKKTPTGQETGDTFYVTREHSLQFDIEMCNCWVK